jgi:hypothetical protein
MIKRFFRYIGRKINESQKEGAKIGRPIAEPIAAERDNFHNPRKSLNFFVYYANGGMIVEIRTFDKKREEWDNQLYIVTEDQDLSEFLSRIITVQMLSR